MPLIFLQTLSSCHDKVVLSYEMLLQLIKLSLSGTSFESAMRRNRIFPFHFLKDLMSSSYQNIDSHRVDINSITMLLFLCLLPQFNMFP